MEKTNKYHIITYGCQMNHSDSERIAAVFEKYNYQRTLNVKEADWVIFNACSIRQKAVDRIWGQVKNLKKNRAKIILSGCVLIEDKKKFESVFDFILDIKELSSWPEILSLDRKLKNKKGDYLEIKPKYFSDYVAQIPIMTGCDNFCTFCVVPYIRDRERSRSPEVIIQQVEEVIKRGVKEIWLLGQNVNSYQYKLTEKDCCFLKGLFKKLKINLFFKKGEIITFEKLLRIVNNIPGDFWIRFTSSHPKDFSDQLIETIAECDKITEYLNLPVQSGDSEILKKMNRPYTIEKYLNLIKKIKKRIPNIFLSTDIIVGFPNETEEQFQNTIKLFKEIRFDMAYIAIYSSRPGTPAAKMEDKISFQEKKERWLRLNKILEKILLEDNQKYLGQKVEVLVDKEKRGVSSGKTRTYKSVIFPGKDLNGKFIFVKIKKVFSWGLKGELCKS